MKHRRNKKRIRATGPRTAARNERRKEERRQKKCQGYCYIEMVGWMDRRESVRRKENGTG